MSLVNNSVSQIVVLKNNSVLNSLLASDMDKNLLSKFFGSLHVFISSISNTNIGYLHPIKLDKLFLTQFSSIQDITDIVSQCVKITYNDIAYTLFFNIFLLFSSDDDDIHHIFSLFCSFP